MADDKAAKREALAKRQAELQAKLAAVKKKMADLDRPGPALTSKQQTQLKILVGAACLELFKTDEALAARVREFLDKKTKNKTYRRILGLPPLEDEKSAQSASPFIEKSGQESKSVFSGSNPVPARERIDLVVSIDEKDLVKPFGAKWDGEKKTWYAPTGTDLRPLEKWLPAGKDWSLYQLIG